MRLGADEHEHRPGVDPFPLAGPGVLHLDPPEEPVAFEAPHLAVQEDLDPGHPLQPVDQVPGHARAEVGLPYHQPHLRRPGGEEHRSLTGRIAATDHDDRLADAEVGLHQSRGVVDARPLEPLDVRAQGGAGSGLRWR